MKFFSTFFSCFLTLISFFHFFSISLILFTYNFHLFIYFFFIDLISIPSFALHFTVYILNHCIVLWHSLYYMYYTCTHRYQCTCINFCFFKINLISIPSFASAFYSIYSLCIVLWHSMYYSTYTHRYQYTFSLTVRIGTVDPDLT